MKEVGKTDYWMPLQYDTPKNQIERMVQVVWSRKKTLDVEVDAMQERGGLLDALWFKPKEKEEAENDWYDYWKESGKLIKKKKKRKNGESV